MLNYLRDTTLEAARADASATLFVTLQILCESYSIVTNPRGLSKRRSAGEATAAISDLLACFHVLPIPAHAVDVLLSAATR